MTLSTASTKTLNSPDAKSVKVVIVDDSAVFRGLVSSWLEAEGIDVVAKHPNGEIAVKHIQQNAPDIVILDIEMPVKDGLTALPEILKIKPDTKVIMASTLTRRNAEISLRALSLGATDYIPKPETNRGITTSSTFRRDLIEKIFALSGLGKPKTHNDTIHPTLKKLASVGTASKPNPKPFPQHSKQFSLRPFSRVAPRLLAIGSSTGGPQALMQLMKEITHNLSSLPVIITQHMPLTFTTILAEHIGNAIGRPTKEGDTNDVLTPGHIYIAPGGRHMLLEERHGKCVIRLDDGPEINYCKPAVDPMFASAAKVYKSAILSLVLTGMGQDGAVGAGHIADAGGSVIAQDEASSVVWGMPGATANMGNASAVLPLSEIGQKVKTLINGGVS